MIPLHMETDEQLGRRDVAWTNLYAARGLPGSEATNVAACLAKLDEWAARVQHETERCWHLYDRAPHEHECSRNRFRALALVTVLQRDLGVHAQESLGDLPDEAYFKRSEHLFVHGLTQGKGGGCSALPVAFAAVGRRLGYPIKLAHAFRHLFARWDDRSGERFNIECTARGFVSQTDEFYANLAKDKMPPEQAENAGHLRSLAPRQELAGFLSLRGVCARYNGWWRVAARAFVQAYELDEGNQTHAACFDEVMETWDKELKALLRPGFPAMRIGFPPRHFRFVPLNAERKIIHLETLEKILTDPVATQQWWEPLRRNPDSPPRRVPAYIEVEYPREPGGEVKVRFLNTVPAYSDRSKQIAW